MSGLAPADDPMAFDEPVTALIPYLRAIRSHWRQILMLTGVTVLACVAVLSQRDPSYEAQAQILVTPLVPGDDSFVGLPIVRTAPGDPTRTVETVAGVIASTRVAAQAAESIGTVTAQRVESAVAVEPEQGANVIDITARAGDPVLAARIATEYAKAVLEVRRAELKPLVKAQTSEVRRQLEALPDGTGSAADALRIQLRALASIRDGSDPTLSIANLATASTSPLGKPTWLILTLAGVAGLMLGAGTVVVGRMLAGHLVEDDEALFSTLQLPVYARVPARPRKRLRRPRGPDPSGSEAAFRLLRAQLDLRSTTKAADGSRQGGVRGVVAVIGATPGDGATSAAFALARAVTATDGSVIVIERSAEGLPLTRFVPVPDDPNMSLITAGPISSHAADQEGRSKLRDVVQAARGPAECVVVDLGPARGVGEALTVIDEADNIVVIVRFGHTRSRDLEVTAELLERGGGPERAAYLVLGSDAGERAGGP